MTQMTMNNTIQAKPITATDFKVVYDEIAYQKIMYYVHKSNHEVSGFGQVLYDKDTKTFRVCDAFLIHQENTGTSSEIDGTAMARAMFRRREIENGMKLHWHSHVNMGTFWSGDDMNIIRGLGQQSWVIASVFNKRNECRTAFYQLADVMGNKHEVFVDELKITVDARQDESLMGQVQTFIRTINGNDEIAKKVYDLIESNRDIDPALVAEWDKEYAECVKEKTYQYYNAGYSKSQSQWDKEWLERWNKKRADNWDDWERQKQFSQAAWVEHQTISNTLSTQHWDKDGYKARVDGTLMWNPVRDKSLNDKEKFQEAIDLPKKDYDELMEEDFMFRNFMNDAFSSPTNTQGVWP